MALLFLIGIKKYESAGYIFMAEEQRNRNRVTIRLTSHSFGNEKKS